MMADSPEDSPVRIVEKDNKDVILVIPDKMAIYVWYRTNYQGEEIEISRVDGGEILVRKYHG